MRIDHTDLVGLGLTFGQMELVVLKINTKLRQIEEALPVVWKKGGAWCEEKPQRAAIEAEARLLPNDR